MTMNGPPNDKPIAIITVGASRIVGSQVEAILPNIIADIGTEALVTTTQNGVIVVAEITVITKVDLDLRDLAVIQVSDATIPAIGMVRSEALILGATEITVITTVDLDLRDLAVVQVSDATIPVIGMVRIKASILDATEITVIVPADLDLRDLAVAQISDTTIRAISMVLNKASILGADINRLPNMVAHPAEWDHRRIRHRSDSLRNWT